MNPTIPRTQLSDMAAIEKLRCYSPSDPYIPENRFSTPEGFRDEAYLIPFTLSIPSAGGLVRGLPIVMDDDVPFYWRAIIFPQAGLTKESMSNYPDTGIPCGLLFRDTRGNALQGAVQNQADGPVLTAGAWCQSGYGFNGAGFPLDAEVECDPGGVVLLDIKAPANNGNSGFATASGSGMNETLTITAVAAGTAGNGIVIQASAAGLNTPLSISVIGTDITVNLATDGAGFAISTFQEVADALNASAPAAALITASLSGTNPGEVMDPAIFGELGAVTQGGGTGSFVTGYLAGVKRYPKCVDGN